MKKIVKCETYEAPQVDAVEVQVEGGYSLSDGNFGGSNEDLGDFDDMNWGN